MECYLSFCQRPSSAHFFFPQVVGGAHDCWICPVTDAQYYDRHLDLPPNCLWWFECRYGHYRYKVVPVPTGCAPSPTSSLVVNVRDTAFGAKGDGVTDDTAAIQRAVNTVAGTGGTVMVPDGTYLVNAVAQNNSMGIILGSNMTLSLTPGAILQAFPNSSGNYAILALYGASNVNIIGGTLSGERNTHTGTTGEWGMGLSIGSSNQMVVQGVTAKECWGDGFYLTDLCTNITFLQSDLRPQPPPGAVHHQREWNGNEKLDLQEHGRNAS